jgi:hypothetical protein
LIGTFFYIETMGDQLMKSQSSRLNPFHLSNYKVSKMDESTKSYFPRKSRLQKLGETIHKQKDYSAAHNIGRIIGKLI